MKRTKISNFKDFKLLNELNHFSQEEIVFKQDKYVYHSTSKDNEIKIYKDGFQTGYDLDSSTENRKAIYFSDENMNNNHIQKFQGKELGQVKINIKDLVLLNLSYRDNSGQFQFYNNFKDIIDRGEIEKIPTTYDGTILFDSDAKITEIVLSKAVANMCIVPKEEM